MPTDAAFRLSTYLTLALSCLCVGYAEYEVLPEVALFAGAAIVALAVLFRLETRVELLSIHAAHRLGLMVGLANCVWGAVRILWERHEKELQNIPWQLMVAAMFGPLLMSLMPAKLARREKHAGDYWALHGMGLAAACLAGAIAEDPVCFCLIAAYAACATWSLSLFYLQQSCGAVLPGPGSPISNPTFGVVASKGKQIGLRRAIWVILLPASAAGLLYLITPRSTAEKFSFGHGQVAIGYSDAHMTDLTQTGDLKDNDKIAFEVTAEEDGHPKTDVSPDQRWRGQFLRQYDGGVWRRGEFHLPGIDSSSASGGVWFPPKLGAGQCTFRYTVPPPHRGEFVADPVIWAAKQPAPIATLNGTNAQGWMCSWGGEFYANILGDSETLEPVRYIQIWRPENDPDLSPPFRLSESNPEVSLSLLRKNPVPRVKEYSDAILQQMIQAGKLPADCRGSVRLLPREEFHERIAREFTAHLATSPDFRYTTDLRREMKELDPIEEFLFHNRAGHCERFATALALMLRSQGIPAFLVLGYKGCEETDAPGKYIVREGHAHAWVTALIPDSSQAKKPNARSLFRWLSLDPTPDSAGDGPRQSTDNWMKPATSWLKSQFRDYISEYTPEKRRRVLVDLVEQATRIETLAIVAGVILLGFLMKTALSRRNRLTGPVASPHTELFARLVAELRPCGFSPSIGETPLEFALRIAIALRKNPATAPGAEVPLDWVEAYYETRFGNKELSPNRLVTLESRLEKLIGLLR